MTLTFFSIWNSWISKYVLLNITSYMVYGMCAVLKIYKNIMYESKERLCDSQKATTLFYVWLENVF